MVFKCIDATRDTEQQRVLKLVHDSLKSGNTVSVKLESEPNNPFDARAIAFMAFIENTWQRIGYVVREVLEHVHDALRNNSIVTIEFAWIKYLLSFPSLDLVILQPVNITRQGEWSNLVIASCSRAKM